LNPAPPCFVIPVFTTSTSNETFAQDLRVSGRIDTFMLFDPHDFLVVQSIAPAIERRPGESGLLAYWVEEGVVLCGTPSQLKSALVEIGVVDGARHSLTLSGLHFSKMIKSYGRRPPLPQRFSPTSPRKAAIMLA
jgi:hypothetical protein